MSDTETKIRYFPVTNIFWSTFICKAVKYVHVRVYESNTYTYYRQLFYYLTNGNLVRIGTQFAKFKISGCKTHKIEGGRSRDMCAAWHALNIKIYNQKVVTIDVFYMQQHLKSMVTMG